MPAELALLTECFLASEEFPGILLEKNSDPFWQYKTKELSIKLGNYLAQYYFPVVFIVHKETANFISKTGETHLEK